MSYSTLFGRQTTNLQVRVFGVDLDGLEVALGSSGVVAVRQLSTGRVVVPRLGVVDVVRGKTEESGLDCFPTRSGR